jgi:putative DNA primase/helicase
VREACRRLGVTVRYNVIAKEIEILIPGEGFSVDNRANAALAWLTSACSRFAVPTGQLGDFLTYLADRNPYNPVAQWITSRSWDGKDRLQELFDTIEADGQADDLRVLDLKEAMIRRWLVSAVAAAFRPNGVAANGVLVIQGEQNLGKTSWFKSLVPAELGVIQDGLMLRPDDRDSVKQVVSYWMVELGELDATFRKSDIAQLKSFLSRDRDTLRRAYAKLESHYARRTVFFASVNPRQFLHDPTGNIRYWTISATRINFQHGIDVQQLWAQVYEQLYQAGESWYLSPDEVGLLNEHNRDHEVLDPIRERLQTRLSWSDPPAMWRWVTATDLMAEIGFDRPTKADVTMCGQIVLELNGGQQKKSNGKRLSKVPPKSNNYGI